MGEGCFLPICLYICGTVEHLFPFLSCAIEYYMVQDSDSKRFHKLEKKIKTEKIHFVLKLFNCFISSKLGVAEIMMHLQLNKMLGYMLKITGCFLYIRFKEDIHLFLD